MDDFEKYLNGLDLNWRGDELGYEMSEERMQNQAPPGTDGSEWKLSKKESELDDYVHIITVLNDKSKSLMWSDVLTIENLHIARSISRVMQEHFAIKMLNTKGRQISKSSMSVIILFIASYVLLVMQELSNIGKDNGQDSPPSDNDLSPTP